MAALSLLIQTALLQSEEKQTVNFEIDTLFLCYINIRKQVKFLVRVWVIVRVLVSVMVRVAVRVEG